MISLPSLLSFTHVIGLALGVGAATVKLTLLAKCTSDHTFVPVYAAVVRPITRLIIGGLVLLTLSGIGWLLIGYSFTPRLVAKIILVVVIWVLGPIIDNVVEPKFMKLAPAPGEPGSPEFGRVLRQYLALEAVATGLFWVVIIMWVLI
jgi:hypothetical protein